MNNKLKEVIEYAVERGWDSEIKRCQDDGEEWRIEEPTSATYFGLVEVWLGDQVLYFGLNDILFNHDFAKAFWKGRKKINKVTHDEWNPIMKVPAWKYHLQQAVISKDPIDYYYKYAKSQN